MLDDLDKLINFIQNEYINVNNKWEKSSYYSKIDLKNNLVCNLLDNELILNTMFKYIEFINKNNIQLIMNFKQFNNDNSTVNARVKSKNSIEYKIKNYIQNHESGEIPMQKCFNDLFGIRIICSENLEYNQIKEFIEKKHNQNLICIDSSKGNYKATHIYFKQGKYNFRWELQIWNKSDETSNIDSHKKYKQDYIRWEKENKGGNK